MAPGRAAPYHSVPTVALRLVPRDVDQQAIARLLLDEDARVVSLVGPPGTGKTRLALMAAGQLAPSFADGVVFVDLSTLRDPGLVAAAIGTALGMREVAQEQVSARLIATLRRKHMLLLLDNFEHLLPAASTVANLVASCHRLKVLTTSREALHLSIEHRFSVEPLRLPSPEAERDLEQLGQVPSVALFCMRASAVKNTWTLDARNSHAVAELCRRLDGLPLAIELAAARIGVLSARAVLTRLEQCLAIEVGLPVDQPERHRTLTAAIGWSYELLDSRERSVFDRLSVFVDGWDEEAAAGVGNVPVVAALPVLTSLAEKHLIWSTEEAVDGEPRFRLLDTLKAFARSQLESTQIDEAWQRHAEHYLSLAERAEHALIGPDQRTWLDRLERELGNFRAALRWALDTGHTRYAVRLAAALWFFWDMRGHLREGQHWLEAALGQASRSENLAERAAALNAAGWLALVQHGSYAQAITTLEEAQSLAREIGDRERLVRAEGFLGLALALGTREFARAAEILASAVDGSRAVGDNWALALALYGQGHLALVQGDLDGCQERWQTCAAVAQAVGNLYGLSYLQFRWGLIALLKLDLDRANACLVESLRLSAELDSIREMAVAIAALVLAAAAGGEPQRAGRLVGAAQALLDRAGCDVPAFLRGEYERGVATLGDRVGVDTFQQWVATGQSMVLPEIMAEALHRDEGAQELVEVVRAHELTPYAPLSAREWEIARLVARGSKNREIAETLVLTNRTVGSHLERVYSRLRIKNRAQLAAWVVERDAGSEFGNWKEQASPPNRQMAGELAAVQRGSSES